MTERESLIVQLEARLEKEHTGSCNSNYCDINKAFEMGLTLWAARLFEWSGAASEKFDALYGEVAPTKAELDAECFELCKQPHVECPKCNAIVWDPDRYTVCGNCLAPVGVAETLWGTVNPLDGELYA